jgi:anti-anti-sigma factor
MKITIGRDRAAAILALSGTFDFATHTEFKEAYERWLEAHDVSEIHIDLGGVSALDASAPGMLLVLRERARAAGKRITVANARPLMQEALALTSFYD